MQYRVTFTTPYIGLIERLQERERGGMIHDLVFIEREERPEVPENLIDGDSQEERIMNLLSDGLPHSTDEILERVYGGNHLGLARIPSRVSNIRKKLPPHLTIPNSVRDKKRKTVFWYQLIKSTPNHV